MSRRAAQLAEPGNPAPSTSTIASWLSGPRPALPKTWESLELLLKALIELAQPRVRRPDPPDLYHLRKWRTLYKQAQEQAAEPVTEPVYQGLAAYQRDDADRFYGRDSEIAALIALLDEAAMLDTPGMIAVVAPSGAGKSSLLQAGLLPALEKRGLGSIPGSASWPTLVITPGQHPLTALTREIPELAGIVNAGGETGTPAPDPREARAAVTSYAAAKTDTDARLILIVDQFEEVFTLTEEAERQTFIDLLQAISEAGDGVSAPAVVVIGMRADFSQSCFGYPPLVDALQHRQRLLPAMTIQQLTEVIEKPAEAAGVKVEPELVRLLLQDTGLVDASGSATGRSDAGVLPLLSHALRITWDKRRNQRGPVTARAYLDVGRLHGAVQQTADGAWSELGEDQHVAGLWLLLNLVHIGADSSRDTRNPREWRELLASAPNPTATERARDVLVRERLLTADTNTVQITHEALMRSWPRLADAINKHRDGLAWRQRVDDAAAVWEHSRNPHWWRRIQDGRDPDHLWRGAQLAAALEWKETATDLERPSQPGSQFLRRSARKRTLKKAFVTSVIGVLSATTLTAFVEAEAATSQRNNAVLTQVVAEADRLRGTDTSLAAQLYLTAYRMRPSPTLASALLDTESAPLSSVLNGHTDIVRSLAYSPDGRTVATSDDSGYVRLWDVSNPDHAGPLGGPLPGSQRVHTVVFSPDGHTLVTGGSDGTVQIWNLDDRAHPKPEGEQLRFPEAVRAVAPNPAGNLLAVGGSGGSVWLWNVSLPDRPFPVGAALPGTSAEVRTVAFSPDGSKLAAGETAGKVQLWDVAHPEQPTVLGSALNQHGVIDTVAFSPDGRILATAGSGQQVQLWNMANPADITPLGPPLMGHANTVFDVAFSPDGQTLASASGDNTIRLWNLTDPTDPTLLGEPLVGHTGGADAIAFSPDGRTLVSGSADHTVRLWHLLTVLAGYHATVAAVAINHAGTLMATGDAGNTVRLLDFTDPDRPQALNLPLPAQLGSIDTVAFSPDGRLLAAGGTDQTVWLWDVSVPQHATLLSATLRGHIGPVYQIAFSPDGKTLASAGADQTVRLWNVLGLEAGQPAPTPVAVITPNTHAGVVGPRDRINGVGAIAFSPDGRTLATGAQNNQDYTVRLWNVTNPGHPDPSGNPMPGHTSFISGLAFSPDGRTLASASADHTLRLWNVASPTSPRALGEPLRAPTNSITSVAYSPDGHTLASGSDDHNVQLWDATDPANAKPMGRPLTGHSGPVRWVAFSPDGHTLVSASRDATVHVWHPSIEAAIGRICSSTANTFTEQQWNQYVSADERYSPPCPSSG